MLVGLALHMCRHLLQHLLRRQPGGGRGPLWWAPYTPPAPPIKLDKHQTCASVPTLVQAPATVMLLPEPFSPPPLTTYLERPPLTCTQSSSGPDTHLAQQLVAPAAGVQLPQLRARSRLAPLPGRQVGVGGAVKSGVQRSIGLPRDVGELLAAAHAAGLKGIVQAGCQAAWGGGGVTQEHRRAGLLTPGPSHGAGQLELGVPELQQQPQQEDGQAAGERERARAGGGQAGRFAAPKAYRAEGKATGQQQ